MKKRIIQKLNQLVDKTKDKTLKSQMLDTIRTIKFSNDRSTWEPLADKYAGFTLDGDED